MRRGEREGGREGEKRGERERGREREGGRERWRGFSPVMVQLVGNDVSCLKWLPVATYPGPS